MHDISSLIQVITQQPIAWSNDDKLSHSHIVSLSYNQLSTSYKLKNI